MVPTFFTAVCIYYWCGKGSVFTRFFASSQLNEEYPRDGSLIGAPSSLANLMKRIFTRRRLLLQFAVEDDGWPFHSGLYRTHDANSFGCRSRRLPRQRHAAWQYNKRKPIKKYIYMRDRLYCYLFDPGIRWCCKCIFIFQPLRAPPTNPQYINKDHKISG